MKKWDRFVLNSESKIEDQLLKKYDAIKRTLSLNELWKQEYKLMQKFTLIEKTVMYRCFADAKWIII